MAKNKNLVAIVTMCFIFAMISFVTNMAAPFGNIWKGSYSWAGMWGNMMNFLAYLFMGIPAGKMLLKIGYKKTTLVALAVGFFGILIQWLSSRVGAQTSVFNVGDDVVTLNFLIYLVGAFICGFCVCMLNTVVNPMLNILGGGGNKGNQYVQIGGTLNSLVGSLTPLFVGVLIGTVTMKTTIGDVAPLLFVAMAVFAATFLIILFVKIPEPASEKKGQVFEKSPWNFRHFVLGTVAIFFYVGIEIGIPGELIYYMSDSTEGGAGLLVNGALIGGAFATVYWLLMMVGRAFSSVISSKVSTKVQLATMSAIAIVLLIGGVIISDRHVINAPSFIYNPTEKTQGILVNVGLSQEQAEQYIADKGSVVLDENVLTDVAESFAAVTLKEGEDAASQKDGYYISKADSLTVVAQVKDKQVVKELALGEFVDGMLAKSQQVPQIPLCVIFFILCGLCTSLMWGGIFNLAVEGLGKYTEQASGIFMMMVVGGGVMPLIQDAIARSAGYLTSYWLVVAMVAYILFYALIGSKNVNKNIKVD